MVYDLYTCVEHFPLYIEEAFEQFNKKQNETHKGVIFLTTKKTAEELLKESQECKNFDNQLKYSVSIIIEDENSIREFKNQIEQIIKIKKYLYKNLPFKLYKLNNNTEIELKKILKNKINKKTETQNKDIINEKNKTNINKIIENTWNNNFINSIRVSNGIDSWIDDMKNKSMDSVISTKFTEFDKALYGGLRSKRLYAVGGITSIGKTTFVMNIADNIASSEQDVLIFSLEMSKHELMIKSLIRQIFLCNNFKNSVFLRYEKLPTAIELVDKIYPNINNFNIKTNRETFTINTMKEKQQLMDILKKAESKYKMLGEHLYIYEGAGNVNISTIRDVLDSFARVNNKIPKLIVIDYLQIMSSSYGKANTNEKQNIDRNITELKKISIDFNTSVIVISSFNRENYYKEVSLKSFKESGGIEYTCDVIIGLQLVGVDWKETNENEKQKSIDEAKNNFPRKIKLTILKNRMYEIKEPIMFDYYTKFDCFI
jgi:replicative DNA helicase